MCIVVFTNSSILPESGYHRAVMGGVAGSNDSVLCVADGGHWNAVQSLCYFAVTLCPAGWAPKNNYSSSSSNSCGIVGSVGICPFGVPNQSGCVTGSHIEANLVPETCLYQCQLLTCTAFFRNRLWPNCYRQ